jgi:hypothetical protein
VLITPSAWGSQLTGYNHHHQLHASHQLPWLSVISSLTPIHTQDKLFDTNGDLLLGATKYMTLVGALLYLTLMHLEISYVVQQICLHMHDPYTPHIALVKRVLSYVCGTLEFGLHLWPSSLTTLTAYSNANWASCPNSR